MRRNDRNIRSMIRGAVLMACLPVVRLPAQDAEPTRWRAAAEANGNMTYGAASQRIVSGTMSAQRLDKRAEFRFDLQATYGDSRRVDSAIRDVIARSTTFRGSVDLIPSSRLTPFGFVTAGTSLQQRLAFRLNVGSGAKYTVWRPDSVRHGFAEDMSISVAMLLEETRALRDASVSDAAARSAAGTRARWSLRARIRRQLSPSLRLTHVTFYQPTVQHPGRFTIDASTVISLPVRSHLDVTLTHRERVDSEARQRGAPSTRDGQVLVGLRAQIRE
jgi:hypothetical protein